MHTPWSSRATLTATRRPGAAGTGVGDIGGHGMMHSARGQLGRPRASVDAESDDHVVADPVVSLAAPRRGQCTRFSTSSGTWTRRRPPDTRNIDTEGLAWDPQHHLTVSGQGADGTELLRSRARRQANHV